MSKDSRLLENGGEIVAGRVVAGGVVARSVVL